MRSTADVRRPVLFQSLARWAALVAVAGLSAVAVAGVALAIYVGWLFHDLPDAGDLADYRPPTSTRVYAWDGTLIGEVGQQKRIFTAYDQIPPVLVRAFLAAEDHKFFQHGGVDVEGLGRALGRDVFRLGGGKRLEGGSTITQQVAKNVMLTNDQTFSRKIKEAILARRIEATLPKQRILELYLNEIWLGNRAYGVAAAAQNYFGRNLSELSLAQMAYLAALPKGPGNYNPIHNHTAAIRRRNLILSKMVEFGFIDETSAQAAMREDLIVKTGPERQRYRDADYFVEETRLRALATVGKQVDDGGLYVRTTLDPRLQTAARVALMKGLEAYDHRHGWRGAWGHVGFEPGWEAQATARALPAERRDWRAAIVDKAEGARVHVILAAGGAGDLEGADVAWANASKPLTVGDLIFVEAQEGGRRYALRQTPAVNGALVAIEPTSGRVLAMVGGYSFSLSKFNRATQAKRQPGSSFKPFVYATALENGFTPSSIVMDAPIHLPGANGEVYSPENYSRRSAGPQIFRNGLVYSRNQMTVRIAQKVGMRKIRDAAKRDGVVDDMAPVLAMALGAGETTPFKLTAAYSAFANGGKRIQPHLIELVEDRRGTTVWRADRRDCRGCDTPYTGAESPRIPPAGEQVMDPITAYQISTMLQGVTTKGTAAVVSSLGQPIAGKTGTTNDFRSAWFVGYTSDLVVGVFVGFDNNASLGEGETGAHASVPIFMDFMRDALGTQKAKDFVAPKNAKIASVHGYREAFRPGTEPAEHVASGGGRGGGSGGGLRRRQRSDEPAVRPGPGGGPVPYSQAFPGGKLPPAAAGGPPPKKPAADMTGLY